MQMAHLITKTSNEAIRCNACLWRCVLKPGDVGRCLTRQATAEGIELQSAGLISAAEVRPIEEYRMWHFLPDTMVLAIGSWGYAFPADQRRGSYANIPTDPEQRRELPPERVAAFALKSLCRGVVWAYSEPAVSLEYALAVLQAARAASRYTVLRTTGFLTMEALDTLGPYLDGVSLDLRGFGDGAYARLAGVPRWQDILEVVARARRHWRCHVEITTQVHHGVNDDPDELRAMVNWIGNTLGEQTPWHVVPGDRGAETAAAVMRARRIGHENGLEFVYGPEPNQPTQCPRCHSTLITRENGVVRLVGISEGECQSCGYKPYLRTSIFKQQQ
jgi:pyruvate formate lyase activating enzyme